MPHTRPIRFVTAVLLALAEPAAELLCHDFDLPPDTIRLLMPCVEVLLTACEMAWLRRCRP